MLKRFALRNTVFSVCLFCAASFAGAESVPAAVIEPAAAVAPAVAGTVPAAETGPAAVESAAVPKPAFSGSVLLDPSVRAELEKTGNIKQNHYKDPGAKPVLYPRTELGAALLDTWAGDSDPVFLAETLYLLKKPESSVGLKNDTDLISKVVRSVSTMEGIPYYSNSEKRMKTLYEKSYTINNPTDRQKIPDVTEGSADNLSIYAFQEDGTFGKIVYEIKYTQRENEVSMVIHNVAPVKLSFITAIKPQNLALSLLIVDEGDDLLVYLLAQIKFPALSLIENALNRSFGARLDATYNWFESEYLDAKKRESEGAVK